ncbi:MAG TPA: DUF302 domain-containing protein, partial [Gemmatimonadales bacterium]|nr:DUF302 domain-containing protein [Gemmatimonadales bacterium]
TATHGVFLRLADGPAGSHAAMVKAVPALLDRAGWRLLTQFEAGTDGCRYKAQVFVVHAPDYAREVLRHGARAAFALPLRLAVYEDEAGVHLALANPRSLARTIVEEQGFEGPPADVVATLQRAIAAGFPGTAVTVDYGQSRTAGLIGKTMGVVAGGPFPDKIETAATVKGGRSVSDVATAIAAVAASPTTRWHLHLAYRLDLPEQDVVVLGLTGDRMEAKAFAIVGEGGDATRKGYACPGIDHAAAFPVELVISRDKDAVKVQLVDEMFRMKMYFEDAGTMKFAANMQMPGSIEDEILDLVEAAF